MSLDWNGDEMAKRIARASKVGINETMGACVLRAKQNHPYTNRTGTAERSVRIQVKATATSQGISGIWGSVQTGYFGFLEFGTRLMRRAFPSLVPAAASEYPLLGQRIKEAFRRGA